MPRTVYDYGGKGRRVGEIVFQISAFGFLHKKDNEMLNHLYQS